MKEIKKVNKSKRKISDEGNRKKKNQNIYINSTNNNKGAFKKAPFKPQKNEIFVINLFKFKSKKLYFFKVVTAIKSKKTP